MTGLAIALGHTAGHTTEMREAIDYLTGKHREARLDQVTRALVAEMLLVGGLCQTAPEAMSKLETALSSGRAAEIFGWSAREAFGKSLAELDLFDDDARLRFEQDLHWLDHGTAERFTTACRNIKNDGVGKGVTETATSLAAGYGAGSLAAAGCAALAVTGVGAVACGVGVLAVGIAGSEVGRRAGGWVYDNALAPAGEAISGVASDAADTVSDCLDKAKDVGGDVVGALNPFG